ncbi:ubiquitin carboxyl-terminal hydrolase 48-like isoform X1 [Neodiprion fabricii]|uniref:ubiquitin carboxyl-terminal hydrolase 48-like isoform X1 n=1 Tax=Neodiprion fabricii TaxID=2872261 RepID=UPI001ED95B35|nr:ubiquitin carboxyl-terminal hydrolase 48-like isoform X1 [Neodiprion fabricii]
MPPVKKIELDKMAWAWVENTPVDEMQSIHIKTAYRIGLKNCKTCKRNCTNNPQCLTGIGEEKYMKSQPAEIAPLESSLSELRDPTQYVGLKNLGATCYVNSLIQVWFHNEDMRRVIYKWKITEDPEESENLLTAKKNGQPYHPITAVGQLQYIFAMLQFGNKKSLDPTNLAIALSLDTRTQQDAQEFSKLLLCHIERKLQQNTVLTDTLQRLSQGKYSYVNCCTTCRTEYSTPTTFYELDLQLAATLKEALETYLMEEELTGANKYLCATCNDKKDARRFIRLDVLPETLNIQLLRFVFHRDSGQKRKLSSYIQFPEDLDMSEYLKSSPQTHFYNLVAVLSHKGASAHSGHYIANICNSNGEWYQFSDDKVEKMHNKRIEDGLNDAPKNVKRSRVPKGFLSSNTAYMLVYKRVNDMTKLNVSKKGRPKKVGSETSSLQETENFNHTNQLETPNDERKADSDSDMPNSEVIKSESISAEFSTESLTEKPQESNANKEDEHSNETADCVKDRETDILKKSDVNQLTTNNTNSTQILKNSKIDYKTLNGAAHRAMSCGQRDFYEEMEFERWEVSDTVRELVKQENVKHELSLLAIQQEKQKDIEDQNDKRQLVIDFFNIILKNDGSGDFQWIPSDWLSKWLNSSASTSNGIMPIDNSVLLCPHHRLDPLRVNRAKYVPAIAADMLYAKYRGGPRLDDNSLCEVCVKHRCKMLRFKMALEKDQKEVTELMRNFKEQTESSYIVGADSLRSWRRLAMEKFTEVMENEKETSDNNENQGDRAGSPKENEESEVILSFNEDLLCEHNSLKTPDASRKLVPIEVWTILQKYFPNAQQYPITTSPCTTCVERMENAQKAKEDDKIKAKNQKDELPDFYYAKNRNEILKCEDPEKIYYAVEKGFVDSWRSFIRYAEIYARTPPPGIQNSVLLCEPHKGLLYHPSGVNEQFSIVNTEEWVKLTQHYQVDHAITLRRNSERQIISVPEPCAVCMLARVEQERLESLKYERATIYVKCVDDSEDGKTEDDTEISAKRPKIQCQRPSRTRRKIKGSHELKVSSEVTLKELKIMMMQICGAGPYDQHLMLGEHELTEHDQSLASLGIYPGALLTLKTDTPIDSEVDVEAAVINHQQPSPEKGFKGLRWIAARLGMLLSV